MFNLNKIKKIESELSYYKEEYNTQAKGVKDLIVIITKKKEEIERLEKELQRLEKELQESKDLKSILQKIGEISSVTYNKLTSLSFINDSGCFNELTLSDNIPQYVEDIFDSEKKVIKQESNLGILIDKEGKITTGRTKLPCDKNKNYKLKQL